MSNLVPIVRWIAANSRGRDWAGPRLIEVIALAGLGGAVLAAAAPAWVLLSYRPDQDHPVNRLLLACQQGYQRGSLAAAGAVAGTIVAIWGACAIGRLCWRAARDLRAMHRFQTVLRAGVVGRERLDGGDVVVVATADRIAFTAGLFRPRVYLGAAMVDEFGAEELRAVLLHEHAHRRRFDPLRGWLVDLLLAGAFWRFGRPLSAYYHASREAAADRAAIRAQGDDRPLLRALAIADPFASVAGARGFTAEREASLRRLRYMDAAFPARRTASLAWGLALIAGLTLLATAGLSDWQGYWFCPGAGLVPS